LEFLSFGVVIRVVEDLVAVKTVTNEPITPKVVGIVILIAIPFAFLGKIIVDKIDFIGILKKILKKNE
jgi:hypothetical protein